MTIVLIAIALYLVASGWLVASVQRDDDASRSWLLPANLALLLHGATHYLAWRGSGITDLPGQRLQLLDRGRTIDVGADHHHLLLALFLQVLG